jgi:dethiobiotin synthetase
VRDLIGWLKLPVVIVARARLGTVNHTLLTLNALRETGATIAGVVVNLYPADGASVAEETNPRAIERWGKTSVLCIAPAEPFAPPKIPPGIQAAIDTVDWGQIARFTR